MNASQLVEKGKRQLQMAAKFKRARLRAWTGQADAKQAEYKVGEKAYADNPHYEDGTRLRVSAERESDFTGKHVLNDAHVEVVEVSGEFAKVRILPTEEAAEAAEPEAPTEGWMRQRNLKRSLTQANKTDTSPGGPAGRMLGRGLERPAPPPKEVSV